MDFSKFFIDRPIFAAVLSIVILVAGLISIPLLPVSEYPEVVPLRSSSRRHIQAPTQSHRRNRVGSVGRADQRRRGMMYMKSVAGSDGTLQMTITSARH